MLKINEKKLLDYLDHLEESFQELADKEIEHTYLKGIGKGRIGAYRQLKEAIENKSELFFERGTK